MIVLVELVEVHLGYVVQDLIIQEDMVVVVQQVELEAMKVDGLVQKLDLMALEENA